jgi:CRISPR-associated DxTHG motif protein
MALCTEQAKADSLPLLQDNLPKTCRVIAVEVPSGHSQADINSFLTKATEAIPLAEAGAVQISLDVTHGFRHFSFLTYIAGLYLVGLRNIELAGAWYGLLQEGESPFLDLRPLLELPRWIHALQVLRDTGSALPLADTLEAGLADPTASTIAKELRQISECYLSALPLELGRQVGQFRSQRLKAMTGLVRNRHQLPLAKELVTGLDRLLLPFALGTSQGGVGWKKTVPLTPGELQRQAVLIDGLFLHKDEAMALGLLNEWTVSWALWCLDDTKHWLNFRSKRRHAASQLGAIAAACQKPALKALLTPKQKALGDFWHLLTNLRNGFHHHGMREEEIVGNPKTAGELSLVKPYWHDTLRACPRFSLQVGDGDGGALLVSPIGHRPGVLYSALLACRERIGAEPSACLVICSSESADAISEAASQAGFHGRISQLVLEDPFGGYQEFPRLRQEAQAAFLQAGDVLVNVTGGTTLMGLAAQELENLARSFARPIQRFGLIDRRPSQEQVADPYRPGEAFWLQEAQEER